MRTVEEHLAACLAVCEPMPVEHATLESVLGLVLAQNVRSTVTLPPFDNSSMDGFAVRLAEVSDAPVTLPVSLDVAAGDAPGRLEPGTAARVMTGAPMPEGADAVVQVEWTDAYGPDGVRFGAADPQVTINRTPSPFQHIRRSGEDVHTGDVVLHQGAVVDPRAVGLLAAVGVPQVKVVRRPRVVVVATGAELVPPGEPLRPGQIHDSNSYAIAAAATAAGAAATRLVATDDDPDRLHERLTAAAHDADLLVTTGGVSAGAYDVVKHLLREAGVDFAKVAMKPGMPQGVGRFDGTPILTLPGNPVSAWVSWEVFGRPMVARMRGLPSRPRRSVEGVVATADRRWRSPAGKVEFTRVRLEGGVITAEGPQQSHLLADLAHANALAVIPADVAEVTDGLRLTCYPLETE